MNNSLSHYTQVRNTQIVLSLLKKKGIKRVIVSPGTTNMSVVVSMTNDSFFEMYSAPDERSAAYMACGMAAESGEPVVLSCTGATASRNYLPGLTEAYYRKLPIVALTSSLNIGMSGHLYPQFINRTAQPVDCVNCSVQIHPIHDDESEWESIMDLNKALLYLARNGGGPIHINLITQGDIGDFSVEQLPNVREITRISLSDDNWPVLPKGKIAIFAGSLHTLSPTLTKAIDSFCKSNDSVVFCDHTSSYNGSYKVLYSIAAAQSVFDENLQIDLLIHIGEVSGDYYTLGKLRQYVKCVWRVNPDGEIRDYFRKLSTVFQMELKDFFDHYSENRTNSNSYYSACQSKLSTLYAAMPELPYSNIWIASQLHDKIPNASSIHFGILNSLRAWNFFPISTTVSSFSNVGGFGIDGALSTLIGASLIHPERLYFAVVGDLAFFYDMNSLGNRHIGNNLRVLLVNNGKGTEFRNNTHPASVFGDTADEYIAAARHYGNQSTKLIKHYADDLGFDYIAASSKEEFYSLYESFVNNRDYGKSIIFEVFTNSDDESQALSSVISIHQRTTTEKIMDKLSNIAGRVIKKF